jgi:hypothetical protein
LNAWTAEPSTVPDAPAARLKQGGHMDTATQPPPQGWNTTVAATPAVLRYREKSLISLKEKVCLLL